MLIDVHNIRIGGRLLARRVKRFFTDVAKYLFRQVPTGAASGYATIEKLEGNTVAWNQLLKSGKLVDMGLPSGLLWATCNIDITQEDGFAASPFQYACSFFSWGNIEGHNTPASGTTFDYNWGSVNAQEPWYEGQVYGSTPGSTLTANIVAGDTYDSARYNLGSLFKMPTSAQFQELFDNCDFVQADGTTVITSTDKRVTVNGCVGIYLKSKINGNLIFFSASGIGNGSSWNNSGATGLYWSSSLYSSRNARYLSFYSGGVNPQNNGNSGRYNGFPVRAVVNPNTIDTGHNNHEYYVTKDINHDLTAIFGAGNEPTTVADFEAWMAQNGLPSVADYNAGELLSVKMSGMQTNTSRLPLGYQELEYLESSGTQYIDTGIVPTLNYEFEIKAKKQIGYSLIGSGQNDYVLTGSSSLQQNFLFKGNSRTYLPSTIDNDKVHIWKVKEGRLYCDNISEEIVATAVTPTNSFALFARKVNSSLFNDIGSHRIYYIIIWDNIGNVVFNGIPTKRLSDNVLGLYDTVSNTFFTNSGTGTFIGGPEVHLDTLPFDVTTITGINTATNVRETIFPNGMKQADHAGTVKDEIDLANGTATVNVGSVDMGTLTWTYNTTVVENTPVFIAFIQPRRAGSIKFICTKYTNVNTGRSALEGTNLCIATYNTNNEKRICITDSQYSDATIFQNAVSGVYLVYELATPITYTDLQDANGNPLNPRYKVEQGGTEQVLPANTSTPTTVAPTLSTIYKKA